MNINTVDKVNTAIRSTSSYIYGVSTLLGQEGCLDYLRAVAEYVQERIAKEKEGWTLAEQNKTSGQVKNYREEIDRRCAEVLQSEMSKPATLMIDIRSEEDEVKWKNELYRKAEQLYGNDAAAIIRAANQSRKRKSLLSVYPSLNDLAG